MKQELQRLLSKYADRTITETEKRELRRLMTTEAGRRAAMESRAPEAIFLGDDLHLEKEATDYDWPAFERRMKLHGRRREHKYTTAKILATAASIILALILGLYWINSLNDSSRQMTAEQENLLEESFKLEHRRIPEVMNELNKVLSEEKSIRTDFKTNRITIKDRQENITAAERLIALLDQPPLQMAAEFELWRVEDTDAAGVQQVSPLSSPELESPVYSRENSYSFQFQAPQRFQQTLAGRWQVTGLVSPDADGIHLAIRSLIVYDMQHRAVVAQIDEAQITPGKPFVISENFVDQDGEPYVITLTLRSQG